MLVYQSGDAVSYPMAGQVLLTKSFSLVFSGAKLEVHPT